MRSEDELKVQAGARAMLRARARALLAKHDHITFEMADAIFWSEEYNRPLKLTREQQAMFIVFGPKAYDFHKLPVLIGDEIDSLGACSHPNCHEWQHGPHIDSLPKEK